MKSIDKNDVDISVLFNWGNAVPIFDERGNELLTLYVRVVGDADLNRARVLGLRKSAELRKKLNDSNSDERLAYIPDPTDIEKKNLIEVIISMELEDIAQNISRDILLQYPKEPHSDAGLEEQEKYQKEIDTWPDRRKELVTVELNTRVTNRRTELEKEDKRALNSHYEKMVINSLCKEEMYKNFINMCVYLGTYKDEKYKYRAFSSYEEFNNLPTYIKDQLTEVYGSLNLDMGTLKK